MPQLAFLSLKSSFFLLVTFDLVVRTIPFELDFSLQHMLMVSVFLDILELRDVVKILLESLNGFHVLYRDEKPLNDLLTHGLVHIAQVILHLVQCLNVRQVDFLLTFLSACGL